MSISVKNTALPSILSDMIKYTVGLDLALSKGMSVYQ